jgi:(1->4)-alpha-D-glucan 1-alpha-D-glucosylmutase
MTVRATYRIQFHRDFGFARAESLVPYFASLGISHLYASPILTARSGSMHGYDVVDHASINPELGGETAFRSLVAALRANGMGVVLDIVPNHMAVGGADNPYWLDVLEKGRESVFANMFDIDWDTEQGGRAAKVVVPLLGKSFTDSLAAGEVTLVWDARLGKLALAYAEHRFPLRTDDYPLVIGDAADPAGADFARFSTPEALVELLSRQHFRLTHWRDAAHRINWRRFFDVSNLAALRVEDDGVFEQTHAAIFRLFGEGLIDGVRVDHVDGLADPASYCRRLRARLEALHPRRPEGLPRERAFIVVEKILADGETLPADWDVDGTTGYDFMNAVSALQHDPAGEQPLTQLWADLSGRSPDFESEERAARAEMLDTAFSGALRTAAAAFASAIDDHVDASYIERGIARLIERFRAYRTYALGDSSEPSPGVIFERALASAKADASSDEARVLDVVASVMRGCHATRGDIARDAVRRFSQLAAPVAAKAVEDTAFYRYGRLLSRNDVGFSPSRFSLSTSEFHAQNQQRAVCAPSSLLATATHDHKRGEDARARLAVLSEIPDDWEREQRQWFALNESCRTPAITPGDEYQLYQTLVGYWPFDLSPTDAPATEALTTRVLAWREKSLREAKLATSWSTPDLAFEESHAEFVRRILDPLHGFSTRLARFVQRIAPAAVMNSLVACVLRNTCPGVPDLYQGTELWDLSLVDPDNRRAVDFDARISAARDGDVVDLLVDDWRGGAVKLALIERLLALRTRAATLFAQGDYRPIASSSERVVAFARTRGDQVVLVAVPRLCATDVIARGAPVLEMDVRLDLPADWSRRRWRDALRDDSPSASALHTVPFFSRFPAFVAVSDDGGDQ